MLRDYFKENFTRLVEKTRVRSINYSGVNECKHG